MELNDYLYGAGRDARNKASAAANDAWAKRDEPAFQAALEAFKAASNGGIPGWATGIDAASYAAQFGLNVNPAPPKTGPVPTDLRSIAARPNIGADPTISDVLKAIADLKASFLKAAGL